MMQAIFIQSRIQKHHKIYVNQKKVVQIVVLMNDLSSVGHTVVQMVVLNCIHLFAQIQQWSLRCSRVHGVVLTSQLTQHQHETETNLS